MATNSEQTASGNRFSIDQTVENLSDQAAVEAYVRVELYDKFIALFGNSIKGTDRFETAMDALLRGSPERVRVWIQSKSWFGTPADVEGDKFINALFDKFTDTSVPIEVRRQKAVEWLKQAVTNTGVDRARIVHATVQNWVARIDDVAGGESGR
jgi:hypothetical protein